ncbi:MAG: rhodanese-like domain-containing protein [Acidobacteria bacterium]|nr:rhodanese-like domain-containing protein [Acidobacteriota bacterium]
MRRQVSRLGVTLCVACLAAFTLATAPVGAQVERLEVDALKAQLDAGAELLLIDVREDHEVVSGSIPGAIHIPVGELEARMPAIRKGVRRVFF